MWGYFFWGRSMNFSWYGQNLEITGLSAKNNLQNLDPE